MKHPAYNLRPNKAVDRSLLVERIRELETAGLMNPRESAYYGFGGPFLDDLRSLSAAFPSMLFHSLEGNRQTYLRQKFHQFSPRLRLYPKKVSDFLMSETIEDSSHILWWLDFTSFCENDLRDVTSVANNLSPGDFLRVTANANVEYNFDSLADVFGTSYCRQVASSIQEQFRVSFEDYLDSECDLDSIFDGRKYPELCVQIILNALKKRDNSIATKMWHLGNRIYRDGVQMVTCEFYFTKKSFDKNSPGHDYLKSLEKNAGENEIVDVPNLSIKERLHLESNLPESVDAAGDFSKKLGYKIDKRQAAHDASMLQYAMYHSHYPMLGKVSH